MANFTEQDAIDLRQPLSLLHKWEDLMNVLWSFFIAYSKKEKNVQVKNECNEILFRLKPGHEFRIGVDMVNSKFLSLSVKIEGNEEFEARINNIDAFGKDGIIRTVADILTYSENVR